MLYALWRLILDGNGRRVDSGRTHGPASDCRFLHFPTVVRYPLLTALMHKRDWKWSILCNEVFHGVTDASGLFILKGLHLVLLCQKKNGFRNTCHPWFVFIDVYWCLSNDENIVLATTLFGGIKHPNAVILLCSLSIGLRCFLFATLVAECISDPNENEKPLGSLLQFAVGEVQMEMILYRCTHLRRKAYRWCLFVTGKVGWSRTIASRWSTSSILKSGGYCIFLRVGTFFSL